MTIEQLEGILKSYKLQFDSVREPHIETTGFPSMIAVFNKLLRQGVPPTQDQFVSAFVAAYQKTHKHLFTPPNMPATLARLKRTYPSFIRDYHLFTLIKEFGQFDRVKRGNYLDEVYGIDILIIQEGVQFYVNAYLGTEQGLSWRKVKTTTRFSERSRRKALKGFHIELKIKKDEANKVGDFWLFGRKHVEWLREAIQRKLQRVEILS